MFFGNFVEEAPFLARKIPSYYTKWMCPCPLQPEKKKLLLLFPSRGIHGVRLGGIRTLRTVEGSHIREIWCDEFYIQKKLRRLTVTVLSSEIVSPDWNLSDIEVRLINAKAFRVIIQLMILNMDKSFLMVIRLTEISDAQYCTCAFQKCEDKFDFSFRIHLHVEDY